MAECDVTQGRICTVPMGTGSCDVNDGLRSHKARVLHKTILFLFLLLLLLLLSWRYFQVGT